MSPAFFQGKVPCYGEWTRTGQGRKLNPLSLSFTEGEVWCVHYSPYLGGWCGQDF